MQYPQPVQPTFMLRPISAFSLSTRAKSSGVMDPASVSEAIRQFSRIISSEFMPDSTQVTSFWSKSQRSAISAALLPCGSSAIACFAPSGRRLTSFPPLSGSMMMTGIPFSAAA